MDLLKNTFLKDFRIFFSYRVAAFGFIFIILANTFLFFYFSKLVDIDASKNINNSSYFVYVLYGLIISDITIQTINRFSNELRSYQLTGIIESLLSSRYSLVTILSSTILFPVFFALLKIFLYFFLAKIFFNIELIKMENIFLLLVIIIIYVAYMAAIGLISASYTLIFKKGNPISMLYLFLATSIGEIFIPIDLLPAYFEKLSSWMPTKISLNLLRSLENSISDVNIYMNSLLSFFLGSLFCIFIAIIIFNKSTKVAKKTGSIIYY